MAPTTTMACSFGVVSFSFPRFVNVSTTIGKVVLSRPAFSSSCPANFRFGAGNLNHNYLSRLAYCSKASEPRLSLAPAHAPSLLLSSSSSNVKTRYDSFHVHGFTSSSSSRLTVPPADDLANIPATCDLTDEHMPDPVDIIAKSKQVACVAPGFRDYGGRVKFMGTATTIKCFENNPLVRKALTQEDGKGKVLVVDGGGSMRCALLGDMLAAEGASNGWEGVIVDGCVRDSRALKETNIGVKARDTHPLKSSKRDEGERDVDVVVGGVTIKPGYHVYADEDGIVVSATRLH